MGIAICLFKLVLKTSNILSHFFNLWFTLQALSSIARLNHEQVVMNSFVWLCDLEKGLNYSETKFCDTSTWISRSG